MNYTHILHIAKVAESPSKSYPFGMYNRPSMFQGRNGSDQLSVFLVAIALVLVIIYPFFTIKYVQALLCIAALTLCGFSLFRMLSTNTAKRRKENDTFLSFFKRKKTHNGAEDVNYREAYSSYNKEDAKRAKKEEKLRKEAAKKEEKAKKAARKESEKTHSYFNCPKCNTELRVPKGKGKIMITCPKCGEKFIEKT